MLATFAKVLSQATSADVDADKLKIILIFCGGGLLVSLMAAMAYSLEPGATFL